MKTRRIMSLVLSVAMVICSTFTAFADTTSGEKHQECNVEKNYLAEAFAEARETELPTDITMPDGVVDTVCITQNDDGSETWDITEGKKRDVLTMTPDGKIFLNENEVIIETTEKQDGILLKGSNSEEYFVEKNPCPGKSWVYQRTEKDANIYTTKPVELLTEAAVLGLIAAATSGIGAPFAVCYAIASHLIQGAAATNSKYISMKIDIYYPNGGRNIGSNKWVEKYDGKFYPKMNYEGECVSKTMYKVTQYF